MLVDLSATAAETTEKSEAEVVDVHKLAEHVEVFDDLRRFYRLEPPHVLRPHSGILVPKQDNFFFMFEICTDYVIFVLKNYMPFLTFSLKY